MTQGLNTPNPLVTSTVGELENTAQRLAREFGIVLDKTPASGISYETELEGNNDEQSLHYLKDAQVEGYEVITAARKDNEFKIAVCEGKYLVILKVLGQDLYSGAEKPRDTKVEKELDALIFTDSEIRKQPEQKHEVCINIEQEDVDSISRKTIEKYLA